MAEKIKKQKEMQFLESELEAVRKLPDVYIGALGNNFNCIVFYYAFD